MPSPFKRARFDLLACPNPKLKETFVLHLPDPALYSDPLDTLVDIGVPAEKEVIQ
jgi:hypothetical protein